MKLPHATRRNAGSNRFRVARVALSVRFSAGCEAAELLNIDQQTASNMLERGERLAARTSTAPRNPLIRNPSPTA
jgi:hypothetical protein